MFKDTYHPRLSDTETTSVNAIEKEPPFPGFCIEAPECNLSCPHPYQPPCPMAESSFDQDGQTIDGHHPFDIFFARGDNGEFLYDPKEYGFGDSSIKPELPPSYIPYQHSILKPFFDIQDLHLATEEFLHQTLQEPRRNNTQFGLSQLETLFPQIYAIMGFDTGTTHLGRESSPQAEHRAIFGTLAHTMTMIMKLTARQHYWPNIQEHILTLPRHQLEPILASVEGSRLSPTASYQEFESALIKSWDEYIHFHALNPNFFTDELDHYCSDFDLQNQLTNYKKHMAHYLTQQFLHPNPHPIYDLKAYSIFEPNIRIKIGGDAGVYVRLRPDQITETPDKKGKTKHIFVVDTKTGNYINNLSFPDPNATKQQNIQNEWIKNEIALRQSQIMLLAAGQILSYNNYGRYRYQDAWRGDELMSTSKSSTNPPQIKSFQMIYECLTHQTHDGHRQAQIQTTEIDIGVHEWREFFDWIVTFSAALKASPKQHRDAISQNNHQLGLFS